MYRVFVLELASWARSTGQRGGLFGQVGANVGALTAKRRWGTHHTDEGFAAQLDGSHKAAYERLFPRRPTPRPGGSDVTSLKDRFFEKIASAFATPRRIHSNAEVPPQVLRSWSLRTWSGMRPPC